MALRPLSVCCCVFIFFFFFFSSRRRHTRWNCDWSSDVCSSDLSLPPGGKLVQHRDPYAGSLRYHLGLVTPKSPGECRIIRSEERRVGKECRSRWSPYH